MFVVVEYYDNAREKCFEYNDFYKAREHASTSVHCEVADITDFDGNVLESWSCGTIAGDYYNPLAK